MKWTYSIKNKTKAATLLLIVFVVVFLNNLQQRKNSDKISQTIDSIYEDRLVVGSYIFQYAEHLHEIQTAIDDKDSDISEKQDQITSRVHKVRVLNESYRKTKLTTEEELSFKRFTLLCENILSSASIGDLASAKRHATEAADTLRTLSYIQVAEAKSLMTDAGVLFSSGYLSSQLEMAILIVIGLIIQALIFASSTLKISNHSQGHSLN